MNSIQKRVAGFLAATLFATMVMVSGVAPGLDVAPADAGCGDRGIHVISDDPGDGKPCFTSKSSACTSYRYKKINDAKRNYKNRCGQVWRFDSGFHRCEWQEHSYSQSGWVCWGPRS